MEDLDALTLALPAALTAADNKKRTITGVILPFNVKAERTSLGMPVLFTAGSLLAPSDLSRIKLLVDHDDSQPVGYCTELTQDDDRAIATFHLPEGERSDQALSDASSHLRDGLSVGVDIREGSNSEDGSYYIVRQAITNEVSMCALPAYADARITNVTASQTRKETTVADTTTPDQATTPAPAETPQPPATPPVATFTQAPAFITGAGSRPTTIEAAFNQVAALLRTGMSGSQVTAALTDITTTADKAHSLLPVELVGKAFQAVKSERPWVERASTVGRLGTGFKIQAWGWKTRPTVGPYTGDKAAIPSSGAENQLFEGTVKRIAGGNDIDRIYVDMADGELLVEIFNAYLADLVAKQDAAARTAILAAATAIPNAATLAAALTALGMKAAEIGSRIDYVAVAPDVYTATAALTKDQVPWWMTGQMNLGTAGAEISGNTIWVDAGLAAGQIIAGDKRAHTWRESDSIRVQAVDVANGGVDLALFSYYAQFTSEPLAIMKTSIASEPVGP